MSELSWDKKTKNHSELICKLNELVEILVTREMQDINSKIEILYRMGLIKDNDKIQELRKKMQDLKQGTIDVDTNTMA